MKLKTEQLSTHLQQSFCPAYVLTGNEIVLLDECVDQIKKTAKSNDASIRSFIADKQFHWNDFAQQWGTPNLFAQMELTIITVTSALSSSERESVAMLCQKAGIPHYLLIVITQPDSNSAYKNWLKKLEQLAVVVSVWPLNKMQQIAWFRRQLALQQQSIEPRALTSLIEQNDNHLLVLKQYIKQFELLFPRGHCLSEQEIIAYLDDQGRFDMFQLVEACNRGDAAQALRILHVLLKQQTEVVLILWAISRELRQLLQLQVQIKSGKSLDTLLRTLTSPVHHKNSMVLALRRLKMTQILSLIKQCAELDILYKTGIDALSIEQKLEDIILLFCIK